MFKLQAEFFLVISRLKRFLICQLSCHHWPSHLLDRVVSLYFREHLSLAFWYTCSVPLYSVLNFLHHHFLTIQSNLRHNQCLDRSNFDALADTDLIYRGQPWSLCLLQWVFFEAFNGLENVGTSFLLMQILENVII